MILSWLLIYFPSVAHFPANETFSANLGLWSSQLKSPRNCQKIELKQAEKVKPRNLFLDCTRISFSARKIKCLRK